MRVDGEGREPSHRAFEELLSEHLDALYRTALRLCGGRETDAEDLLQEMALRALRSFRDLRDQDAVRSWLFTILTRTHLNRVRAAGRRAETFSGDLEEPAFERALEEWRSSETPEDVLESRLLRERLATALDALEPAMRAVVWLIDVEEFRQREVAEMLEVPEGTVASRLYRVRRRLRDVLDPSAERAKRRRS
jgi:RNA polymerase sigma factor (sigma-70 family)